MATDKAAEAAIGIVDEYVENVRAQDAESLLLGRCRCGHLHSEHSLGGGYCHHSLKECGCGFFVAAEQNDDGR